MANLTPTTRFRFWLWLICVIGVIVPRRLRADWRQEWEAELRYRERLLAEWDRLDRRNKLELLRRSLAAFWDALWLQPQRWEDEMFQDLRFGARMLLKSPNYTLIAALTLALGIGANTAIFSVVNAVMLRPLPYRDPDQLVHAYRMQPPVERSPVSVPAYLDFAAQQQVFGSFAAHYGETFNLTDDQEAERVIGRRVTQSFFALFGVSPARGRFFNPADDDADSARVAVIGDGLWRRRFGGDDRVVGQTIRLNGEAYTVVGVAPPEFQFPRRVEIWTPARLPGRGADRTRHFLMMVGRLEDGVTGEQAQAQMNQIATALARQYPSRRELSILISPMLEEQVRGIRTALWVLLGAVGFVLLIACANVANLLLARSRVRARAVEVRAGLGAGRFRIVLQPLTETVVLEVFGSASGILLAFWGVDLL